MSLRATKWAWAAPTNPTAKLVLLALADHADEVGLCWPSVPRLAQMTGLTERAVYNALPVIERAGLMACDRRPGRPTRYQLRIGAAAEIAPMPPEPLNVIHPPRPSTPEPDAGVTPERRSPHPCTTFRGPLNDVQGTPERRSPEPSRTVIEPPLNHQVVVRAPSGSRLPPGWLPSDADIAFALGLGLSPDTVADTFRDYWAAQPGTKGRKTDWPATWRNWCRRDASRTGPRSPPQRESKTAWLIRDMRENP